MGPNQSIKPIHLDSPNMVVISGPTYINKTKYKSVIYKFSVIKHTKHPLWLRYTEYNLANMHLSGHWQYWIERTGERLLDFPSFMNWRTS